ncbi:hypothetical protein AGLY_008154 [Aphis glycines]|uniref:Uncharacterized protein n=1 Tax=Aphis glycines TaxID=307491 RepID=A0A6G0TL10_APHGL|nr:hypothetical protein AGLY_008154 [Aphis glycines]
MFKKYNKKFNTKFSIGFPSNSYRENSKRHYRENVRLKYSFLFGFFFYKYRYFVNNGNNAAEWSLFLISFIPSTLSNDTITAGSVEPANIMDTNDVIFLLNNQVLTDFGFWKVLARASVLCTKNSSSMSTCETFVSILIQVLTKIRQNHEYFQIILLLKISYNNDKKVEQVEHLNIFMDITEKDPSATKWVPIAL